MGAIDSRNMQSNLAVNKYLHTVASCWISSIYIHHWFTKRAPKSVNNTFTFVSIHQPSIFNEELVSPAQIKDTKFMENPLTKVEILEQSRFKIQFLFKFFKKIILFVTFKLSWDFIALYLYHFLKFFGPVYCSPRAPTNVYAWIRPIWSYASQWSLWRSSVCHHQEGEWAPWEWIPVSRDSHATAAVIAQSACLEAPDRFMSPAVTQTHSFVCPFSFTLLTIISIICLRT